MFFGKGGSNFVNLLEKESNYKIVLGITNEKNSKALERSNLPEIMISQNHREILEKLKKVNPDLIVLAGYMRIIPDFIIKEFEGKIINLHPSILPEFKGLNADKKSYEAKRACGITIHFASEELDGGDVILQYRINPEKYENFEKYHEALKKAEHTFLPAVIERFWD